MNIFSETAAFARDLWLRRGMIAQLAARDFQNRYTGSTLGFVWTFIQPLTMVAIFWFVLGVVFDAGALRGAPFFAYVLVGISAWNFFSEAILMSTGVFQEYAFLVRKVDFKIAVLPIVKILSSLFVHAIFLGLVMLLLLLTGTRPTPWWFQTLYYLAGLCLLLLGTGLATSSLNVFSKDVAYLVNVLLQFGFWLTPIIWHVGQMEGRSEWSWCLRYLKLNPMFYIVEGYRKSLINPAPFWGEPKQTLYFWAVTLLFLLAGTIVFKRLKPHFADVL